jgi:hypothetical protein
MCPLRRVDDAEAGPHALGILVPPGRRTVVIVRPRALIWDLLLTDQELPPNGSPFRKLSRREAETAAQGIYGALDAWFTGGPGGVEAHPLSIGEGYLARAWAGPFALLACLRMPGQLYRPLQFRSERDAAEAAAALQTVLFPSDDREQEVYFNTRHFA